METKLIKGKWYKNIHNPKTVLQFNGENQLSTGYYDAFEGDGWERYGWASVGDPKMAKEWIPATYDDLEVCGTAHRNYVKPEDFEEPKVYTTEDLQEGRVGVVITDDVKWEDIFELCKRAFPEDSVCENYTKIQDLGILSGEIIGKEKDRDTEWFAYSAHEWTGATVNFYDFYQYPNVSGGQGLIDEFEGANKGAKLIRRFPSGAVRSDSTGRPRPDWLSPYALTEISKVLVENENDFGACNYMLGLDETACLESLMRHTLELQEAILINKDMNEAKIVARSVGFNVISLLHTIVLKEKGLYKKVFDKVDLVTVEQAKAGNTFTDK